MGYTSWLLAIVGSRTSVTTHISQKHIYTYIIHIYTYIIRTVGLKLNKMSYIKLPVYIYIYSFCIYWLHDLNRTYSSMKYHVYFIEFQSFYFIGSNIIICF